VSAYRFCRTDDIALLVEAHRQCWLPHFPDEAQLSVDAFKREIRELQLWCSSCMVAFAGDQLVGFLNGAKRAKSTLIHRIAVHPDHLRQGHARHLLTSLSSKLAILGPPRLVAEIPDSLPATQALFEACGYQRAATLTDYLLPSEGRSPGGSGPPPDDTFLVPITMEDVEANDLLAGLIESAWERSAETLRARTESINGLAMATVDRIASLLLHRAAADGSTEILALRALEADEDAQAFLSSLVAALARRNRGPIYYSKAHPDEVPAEWLAAWGLQAQATYGRYVTTARPA